MTIDAGRIGAAAENDPLPETAAEILHGTAAMLAPADHDTADERAELERAERQLLDEAAEARATNATAPEIAPDELETPGVTLHDDYDEGDAEYVFAGMTIEDVDAATWAAEKHARLSARRARLKQIRDDRKARLERWFDHETARIDRDLRFFAGRLEGFHRAALDADPRNAKTIRLPDGTELQSDAGRMALEVDDAPALLAWAEAHELADELFRYPEPEPEKITLAKRYGAKAKGETEPGTYPAVDADTGEVIPGISIVRRPRTYTIRGPVT